MTKKRQTLNTFIASSTDTGATPKKSPRRSAVSASPIEKPTAEEKTEPASRKKRDVVLQTVYLPPNVHKQLRSLAFEEEKKMHDLLMEGLDLVFRKRGLKPFDELLENKG